MKELKDFFWGVSALSSVIGVFVTIIGVLQAGDLQNAGGPAAVGIAFAVIPYCLARAVSEFGE